MMVTVTDIQYEADGATMSGRLALPDGTGPWPGVLVAHEANGLDEFQRDKPRNLAEAAAPTAGHTGHARCGSVGCSVPVFGDSGVRERRTLRDYHELIPTNLHRLADSRYILLTTFRENGQAVPTAVGTARDGDELLVWTAAKSGKVKRIRRDGTVEIAPCDRRGNPTGDPIRGTARVLDQSGIERTRSAIQRKYGTLARIMMFFNRIRGSERVAAIAVTLDD
jgi:PPOX class probable F420-dependent enzyme